MQNRSRILVVAIASLALLAGCEAIGVLEGTTGEGPSVEGGGSGGGGASLSPFIVNGQIDTGHPAVGKLYAGGSACTATLVGTKTVLTAGHCVDGGSIRFEVGGYKYNAAQVKRHEYYGGGNSNDVALVILSQAVTNVTPMPIATKAPTVGQNIVLVGFGNTSEGSGNYGTKRMGNNTISSLGNTTLSFNGSSGAKSNICNGDSGGPTFAEYGAGNEVVIGVHSTKAGTCGYGGTDMRVDAYKEWIVKNGGSDVKLAGDPTPPGGNPPPPNEPAPPPPGSGAGEGESCLSQACQTGLACTKIQNPNTGQLFGQWCLEKCSNPGGADPICDGSEKCTNSSAGPICFAVDKPATGYADIGGGAPPPDNPPPTDPPPGNAAGEGESCLNRACGTGLACVTVFTAYYQSEIGRYCMERCQTLGNDPTCDGGEVCTNSRSAGLVCFLAGAESQGFTNHGGSAPPPANPPGTPPGGSGGSCGGAEESAAFDLLNQTRAQYGLQAVACDPAGLQAARGHSQDMCNRNYFSHTSPEGRGHSYRLQQAGASFSAAGENIAYGYQTPQAVTTGWMNSSGHRQNMLTPSWQKAAVGAYNCSGTWYWTEVLYY
ncbi:MAG: trypsin-like serine protease [Armatimonadetes bacterium]|nr:trypsin-like serine protease [Armatimonadota bacterium]